MRCSELGRSVAVAIVASRAPGRSAWVVRPQYAQLFREFVVGFVNMKNSTPFITLALLSLTLAGCSSVADLGVIELTPNVPKHIKVGGADWTLTAKRDASGKEQVIAESAGRKVTQKDIANGYASPNAEIGATLTEQIDLTDLPAGQEVTGYFGGKQVRYTLKHAAN